MKLVIGIVIGIGQVIGILINCEDVPDKPGWIANASGASYSVPFYAILL